MLFHIRILPPFQDNLSGKDVNQGILVISNLDSSVSNNELHQIFGIYGEIKQASGLLPSISEFYHSSNDRPLILFFFPFFFMLLPDSRNTGQATC